MRCKLDENLGRSAVEALESAGHDVSSIHRQQMSGADDRRVFGVCLAEARILVTFDLDFVNPLVFDPRPSRELLCSGFPRTLDQRTSVR